MMAAAPKLVDEVECARTTAIRQIQVLMRAAGMRVGEDDLRGPLAREDG